jgi:mannose/fructose/N-acetylgalactosamine-specific phosphotransferase system component IIB
MQTKWPAGLVVLMILGFLVWAAPVPAADVGQFNQVVNQVDHLRQGQAPPLPAKVQSGVANQDQVHTKEKSMAVVQFVDDSTMTISPKSRVTIEDYMYDAGKGQTQGTVKVFQGVVESVIPTTDRLQKKDLKILTTTAIAGIRGTRLVTVANPEGPGQPESTIFYVIPHSKQVKPETGKKPSVRIRTYAPEMMPAAPAMEFVADRLQNKVPLDQILDEGFVKTGFQPCTIIKAAIVQGVSVDQLAWALQKVYAADPEKRKVCTPCTTLQCAVEALRALKVVDVGEMQSVTIKEGLAPIVAKINPEDLDAISRLVTTGIEGPIPNYPPTQRQMDLAKLPGETRQIAALLVQAGASRAELNVCIDDMGIPSTPVGAVTALPPSQLNTSVGQGGSEDLPPPSNVQ